MQLDGICTQIKLNNFKMKQIYKNLYYDEETKSYCFISDGDRREVVDQQSYLIIYLLEVMLNGNG